MQTVKMKLSDLHKTDKNIRRHSSRQIEEYIRSLKMFGQIRPLVVTEDGEILIGNGMYEALVNMGKEECDAYIVTGLSKAEKRKLMLADNKVYEMGFTDVGMLDDILKDLDGDFDVPGYDPDLLNVLIATPTEITTEVTEYGTFEPELTSERHDTPVYASDTPVSPYEPPKQTSNGAFVDPNSEEEKPFIICPHCGEKIWL